MRVELLRLKLGFESAWLFSRGVSDVPVSCLDWLELLIEHSQSPHPPDGDPKISDYNY